MKLEKYMNNMQRGSKGENVEKLQIMLNLCMPASSPLKVDGDFGNATSTRLAEYCSLNLGGTSQIATQEILSEIEKDFASRKKFLVVLDAGHGGMHPETNEYMTPPSNGKRYRHKGVILHDNDGNFFEGKENRIVANMVCERLRNLGFLVVMASHDYLDWWGTKSNGEELTRRGTIAEKYLENGFCGYFHSFHSNAAPSSIKNDEGIYVRERTKKEMDDIVGGEVYTTKGDTLSDKVAQILIDEWIIAFGKSWLRSVKDKEADFGVLTPNERLSKKFEAKWAAFLEEFGVFTSERDCKFIIDPTTRSKRTQAAINLCQKVFKMFFP